MDIFKEYAEVKEQLKFFKAREEELKTQIVADYADTLKDNPDSGKREYGTFKMYKSESKYQYSDKLKRKLEDLEILKEDEKEKGIATPIVSWQLRFNPKK